MADTDSNTRSSYQSLPLVTNDRGFFASVEAS
ncbi:hypothetical protein Q5A_016475 [Serratia inhibens PRI-2C]|nr:hypothetical protein Q5A_016475 [Serratia inhibens PRI-2C]